MLSCTYEVVAIDGDYAHLRRNDIEPEDNEMKLVARALLPPEIMEGSILNTRCCSMKSLADAVFPAEVFSLPLFHGISETGRAALVSSGWLRTCSFEKNQTIYHMGDRVSELGIVLSGSVFVENTDLWGNRSILSKITPGQVFAETYAFCREPMMVNVTAAEVSTVLFFNLRNLDQTADGDDAWLSQLRSNMLRISMQKNLTLSNRIFCTTPKTIRERVLVYLSAQSAKTGADTFTIPFDRQGLADYLNLDRSALSKELGKMQKEGILEFHKNKFTLRHPSL